MKKYFLFLFTCCMLMGTYGDNKSVYENLLSGNKMDELSLHLSKWQKAEPKNPEMYIGYFNYYLHLAMSSGVSIDTVAKDGASFMEISDPKTGKVVGYINDKTFYDLEKTEKGLSYLTEGLKSAPDRLDMVFGMTHVLIEIKEYERAVDILTYALDRSLINKNRWLWSDNQKVDDGADFLLGNMQDYYNGWINENTPQSMHAVESMSLAQIKNYPDHVYAYDNYAVAKSIKKEYPEALAYLLKAEKLAPGDLVVINNIARCYQEMGNTKKAVEYYSKIVKGGDKDFAVYAQGKIDSLKQ